MISTFESCRLDQGAKEPYSENRPKGKEVGSTHHRRGPRLGPEAAGMRFEVRGRTAEVRGKAVRGKSGLFRPLCSPNCRKKSLDINIPTASTARPLWLQVSPRAGARPEPGEEPSLFSFYIFKEVKAVEAVYPLCRNIFCATAPLHDTVEAAHIISPGWVHSATTSHSDAMPILLSQAARASFKGGNCHARRPWIRQFTSRSHSRSFKIPPKR